MPVQSTLNATRSGAKYTTANPAQSNDGDSGISTCALMRTSQSASPHAVTSVPSAATRGAVLAVVAVVEVAVDDVVGDTGSGAPTRDVHPANGSTVSRNGKVHLVRVRTNPL